MLGIHTIKMGPLIGIAGKMAQREADWNILKGGKRKKVEKEQKMFEIQKKLGKT